MEEDSIDESESLVSPKNLQLRGAFRGDDEERKETGGQEKEAMAEDEKHAEKSYVNEKDGTERSQGLIDHLLHILPVSVTGTSKDESVADEGLIDHLLHGLPASITEDAAPASDEATLLISTIIHE